MTLSAPELWNDAGPDVAFASKDVRALLDLAQPPELWPHAGPDWLAAKGASLTTNIRTAYPTMSVGWAVAGDADGPDPTTAWVRATQAAWAAGIRMMNFNCESGWFARNPGTLAHALNAVVAAAPDMELCLDTAGQPLYIPNVFPPPSMTGNSDQYAHVLRESVGLNAPLSILVLQVYYSASVLPTTRGAGPRSLARSIANRAVAVAQDDISPGCTFESEQQLHGCRCDDLVNVATQSAIRAWWWALNGGSAYVDQEGSWALQSVCALHRLGFDGPLAVFHFQKANNLVADNVCGPKTRAALGVK
jgi:hypothetical protein